MGYRLLRKNVEVLYGVIQDDAGHGDTSQGIGHIDSGVRQIAGFIHDFYLFGVAKVHIFAENNKFLGYTAWFCD